MFYSFESPGRHDLGGTLLRDTYSHRREASPFEQTVTITTVDRMVNEHKIEPSIIKLDVEGAERETILGAMETIKHFRPVLILSVYHHPKDFFEIKPLIESLDLGYHFLLRRLDLVNPMAGVSLLAYCPTD